MANVTKDWFDSVIRRLSDLDLRRQGRFDVCVNYLSQAKTSIFEYPGDLAKPRIKFVALPAGYPNPWYKCSATPEGWIVSLDTGSGSTPELAYKNWRAKKLGVQSKRLTPFSDAIYD